MPLFVGTGSTRLVGFGKRRNLRGPSPSGPGVSYGIPDSHVTVIISDTFTHADNFNIAGTQPDAVNTPGHNWAAARGSWIINGNKLTTGVNAATIGVAADTNELTVDVDITMPSTIDATLGFAVILHMQSNSDSTGTYCGWDDGIGYRVGNGGVGVSPTLATIPGSVVANTTYHWKIIATAAGGISWYLDGALLTAVAGASTSFGTSVAPAQFAPTNRVKYDNLIVKS